MKTSFRIFVSVLLLCQTSFTRAQSNSWNLEQSADGMEDIWLVDSQEDLIRLSDPNSMDADGDGSDDFTDLEDKWSAHYKLGGNIAFSSDYKTVDWNNDGTVDDQDSNGFSPIGDLSHPFTGQFNGAYDTITNLVIKRDEANQGLFGVVKGAYIKDLGLEDLLIRTGSPNAGGLAGQTLNTGDDNTRNTIRNCFVKGQIISTYTGNANTGGLAGLAEDVLVEECYTSILLQGSSTGNKLGGLIGSLSNARISNCYVNAWVSGDAQVGAMFGSVSDSEGSVIISDSYSMGSGDGLDQASSGGFIGSFLSGETRRCLWNAESSSNDKAVGNSTPSAVIDITSLNASDLSKQERFPGWDFNQVWEMGEQDSKLLVLNVNYEPVSVRTILNDGQGDFDPWNAERWSEWYNGSGEIIRPFHLNTDIRFKERAGEWIPDVSAEFNYPNLFEIATQGIEIDGNGVIIDIRSNDQKLSIDELYTRGRNPWQEGTQIQGFHYNLPYLDGRDSTVVRDLTVKGFRRGFKIDNKDKVHPILVKDCKLIRNGIGFYTNGNSGTLKNCELMESGNGAIYSGSKSHDNTFIGNQFRDNTLSQHQYSYGDFIGDTYYNSLIADNQFLPSLATEEHRLIGISVYRNMGEDNNLREQMPHNNIIRNNHFNGYSVAIHMGSRMGRQTGNDITDEGRDYAFYNLIDSNHIENTAIGIKINTEGNTVRDNEFTNVPEEIVLQCVFFSLENTTISDQAGDSVKLWYVLEDYTKYQDWFPYQSPLNGSILKSEKQIEVFSQQESPHFPSGLDTLFVLNPPDKGPEYMLEDHRLGLPMATDTGEFSLDLPGYEIAAIWDEKISRIKSIDYYSILIFDDQGTEINRCGRSEVKWGQIAVGYFIREQGEMEIAVVPAEPVEGKYPVYIFRRGFREPEAVWYQDNTDPTIQIATDEDDNLIVTFGGK